MSKKKKQKKQQEQGGPGIIKSTWFFLCNSNLKGFNFYYFKAWSHAHIVSDILDDTAFCILGENYYSTVTKVEGQMYISNVVGNGDITFNNNVVTINIADKFGIIISNKEITIK